MITNAERCRIYRANHLEECRARERIYTREHPARDRKNYNKLKFETLSYYGKDGKAVCMFCDFSDIRALSIDHIDGGGSKERRESGRHSKNFYYYLKRLGYPIGYQTLCMNCQFIKRSEKGETREVTRRSEEVWKNKYPQV